MFPLLYPTAKDSMVEMSGRAGRLVLRWDWEKWHWDRWHWETSRYQYHVRETRYTEAVGRVNQYGASLPELYCSRLGRGRSSPLPVITVRATW